MKGEHETRGREKGLEDHLKPKILVVDNDLDVGDVLSLLLKKHGFDADYCSQWTFKEHAGSFNPTAIILNNDDTRGHSTMKSIREQYGAEFPVIYTSAESGNESKDFANANGAYFCRSPMDPPLFMEFIKKVLGGKR